MCPSQYLDQRFLYFSHAQHRISTLMRVLKSKGKTLNKFVPILDHVLRCTTENVSLCSRQHRSSQLRHDVTNESTAPRQEKQADCRRDSPFNHQGTRRRQTHPRPGKTAAQYQHRPPQTLPFQRSQRACRFHDDIHGPSIRLQLNRHPDVCGAVVER